MLECHELTKTYGSREILKNVSFSVGEVGCVGFLGANGAGKTTTIRILTGLARPTSGVVKVAGLDVTQDMNRISHVIGYCPQNPAFYQDMTGQEWMHWVGGLFQLDKKTIRSKTEELLKLCHIYEAKDRSIGSYSGGMKQRLAIAQALINSPKVLILDEPVSALDPMGRKDVLTLIERLKDQMLIFMSTHILDDIERVADHIIMIKNGEIYMSSSMKQIQKDYVQPVIEFQLEKKSAELVTMLNGLDWVEECIDTGETYQVRVSDKRAALKELPGLITSTGGILLHYQLSKLTLEDIFLKVVNA
ncbi:ABC transporter ATP-binding protein [Bacillus sp. 179-C3.3 HS]|uniref:ABC transporter ATP-binding protein n=1 Tax=Bacillus sp. 179-C3.3 HS TaxID=3232162 RepID=UPI00399EF473